MIRLHRKISHSKRTLVHIQTLLYQKIISEKLLELSIIKGEGIRNHQCQYLRLWKDGVRHEAKVLIVKALQKNSSHGKRTIINDKENTV